MQIELMAVECVLRRWLKNPDAPIFEISSNSAEKRSRPYTVEEVQKMKDSLKHHAPGTYERLFGVESE